MKFAFEETPIQEIVAVIDADNAPSRHVLEKSGLTYTGMRMAYAEQKWLGLSEQLGRFL